MLSTELAGHNVQAVAVLHVGSILLSSSQTYSFTTAHTCLQGIAHLTFLECTHEDPCRDGHVGPQYPKKIMMPSMSTNGNVVRVPLGLHGCCFWLSPFVLPRPLTSVLPTFILILSFLNTMPSISLISSVYWHFYTFLLSNKNPVLS